MESIALLLILTIISIIALSTVIWITIIGLLVEVFRRRITKKIFGISVLISVLISAGFLVGLPMLMPIIRAIDISPRDAIIASVGNFFSSGPFDPALREIWAVVVVVTIVGIIFLKRRR